jgi:Ca2+-binding RTX toxin-like protein
MQHDSIMGGAADDTLVGGSGNDTLLGGTGDDRFEEGAGNDVIDGGDGRDMVIYNTFNAAPTDGVLVNLEAGFALGHVTGLDSLQNVEDAIGTNAGDVLIGSSGDNVLDGVHGDDTILGLGGDDWIVSGAGNDYIDGGSGIDTLAYSSEIFDGAGADDFVNVNLVTGVSYGSFTGHDTFTNIENVSTGDGNDIIVGDANDNYLTSGGGDDILYGGAGDDHLDGGRGDDQLHGGDGNDLLFGQEGDDLIDGGAGVDFVGYDMYGETPGDGVRVDLAAGWAVGVATGSDALISIENIAGTQVSDTIYGSGDSNYLSGQAGDDFIDGRGGNDFLEGGAGNDTLVGGAGDDDLTGGAGNDTFVFSGNFGHDTIEDFAAGSGDVIQFSAANFASVADVIGHASYDGIGVFIDAGSGSSVELVGLHLDQLSSSDFLIV